MTKIVVIQTAFPGDVILSLPVFEALKGVDKTIYTSAVIRPESSGLLGGNPFVDEIIIYDKYGVDRGLGGIRKMAARLRGYNQAIIIQRHLRSALIAYWAGIPVRIGFDNSSARLLYTSKVNYRRDRHEVQRCLDLIDVDNSKRTLRPRIYLGPDDMKKAETLLGGLGINSPFALIAPGSVWATKRYPRYADLIDLIADEFHIPVLLAGSSFEKALCEDIVSRCREKPNDISGQTDLRMLAAIISKAEFVVSNDSAPAHLAAAVGTPVISIFGPTSPAIGFSPYSERSAIVEIGRLYCRPCTSHGSRRCPERHFDCMERIAPWQVMEAIKNLRSR